MSKKPNAWMAHVMRTKAANPGMQLKDVLRKAGGTYKKDSGASASASSSIKHKSHKKHGGLLPIIPLLGGRKRRGGEPESDASQTNAALPGAVQSDANGKNGFQVGGGPLSPADVESSGTALQLNASAYGGGKKSRRSRKGKSSRKGSRKSKSKGSRKSKKRSRRHRKLV